MSRIVLLPDVEKNDSRVHTSVNGPLPMLDSRQDTAFVEFNAMGSGLEAHSLLAYLNQAEAFFRETRVLQNIWIQARASMDRLPMTVSASYVLCF